MLIKLLEVSFLSEIQLKLSLSIEIEFKPNFFFEFGSLFIVDMTAAGKLNLVAQHPNKGI